MPVMITFFDKLAFWRGTKRFTDDKSPTTVQEERDSKPIARESGADTTVPDAPRVVRSPSNSASISRDSINPR